jgi:N-acetylglucosaminyl-diphospho-decaprenol L-rhamnosyltransferase
VNHPRLSIVIVSYRSADDLALCLPALAASDMADETEIIVVDNAPGDGTADIIRARFPAVKLVEPGRNLYFCPGNNAGLDVATGTYALLLNPDTVPPPDAMRALVAFMDAHPQYAGATLQLRYPNGEVQRTCSRIPTFSYLLLAHTPLGWLLPGARRRTAAHHWYADDGWDRTTSRDVQAVPGSCVLMRRADLRLNGDLLLYFNEDDLARRFAGQRFHFLAEPFIEHREKSVTRSATAARIYFRDMIVYTRAHHGLAAAVLLWLGTRPLLWAILLRWRLRPRA